MTKLNNNYQAKKAKYFFGKNKETNESIYLTMPTWDCGWYWSFGYLGNIDCHYHLDSHFNTNKNIYDELLEKYELNTKIKNKLWEFCEIISTVYSLKNAAEIYNRGGSHYTNNPCADVIKNPFEVTRLNDIVLPALFKKLENLLI